MHPIAAAGANPGRQPGEKAQGILAGAVVRRKDEPICIDCDREVHLRNRGQVALGADGHRRVAVADGSNVTDRAPHIVDDPADPGAQRLEACTVAVDAAPEG